MSAAVTTAYYDALIAGGGSVSGILSGSKIMLFVNNPIVNKNTVLADLTEPIYPGYVRQTLTWSDPHRAYPSGDIVTLTDLTNWQMTDASTPTMVMGIGVVDAGETNLLMAGYLDGPAELTDALSFLGTVVELSVNTPPSGTVTMLV